MTTLIQMRGNGYHDGVRSFNFPIRPITVIVGPNESGKTTALETIDLVVSGPSGANYPALGTSPDYDWSAILEYDGHRVERYMRRGKHQTEINGVRKGVKAASSWLLANLGKSISFSLSAFLSKSPNARMEYLQAEILGAGADRAAVEENLRALDEEKLALVAPENWPPKGRDGRELIANAVEAMSEAYRDAKRQVQQFDKTIKHHQEKRSDITPPSGTVAGWREKVASINEKLGESQGELGRIEGAATARKTLESQLEAVRKRLANDKPVDELQAAVDAAKEARTESDVRKQAAKAEWDTAKEAVAQAQATRDAAQHLVDTLSEQHKNMVAIESDPWAALARIERVAAADGIDIMDDIAALREVLPDPAFLSERIDQEKASRDGSAVILGANMRKEDALRVAWEKSCQDWDRHDNKVKAAERQVTLRQEREADRDNDFQDVERLRAELADLPPVGSDGEVREYMDTLKAERDEAQAAADALTDWASQEATIEKCRADKRDQEDRRTDAHEIKKQLLVWQGAVLAQLVGPLEAPASDITQHAMGADIRFDLTDGCKVMIVRGDEAVPMEQASASQQTIAAVAVTVALRHQLGGWRCVVVDDLEHLDTQRRDNLVDTLYACQESGYLDNAILACVDDGWRPGHDIHTIDLGIR